MRTELPRAGKRGLAKAMALPMLLLMVLAAYAWHQAPPASPDHNPESFRIKVDVALVVLNATVTDRDGGFASNLREQDFAVYEDGVAQRIRLFQHEDVPVTVGLVVDHSGSMGPKLAEVIAAARTFVQSSNPQDQMFVVNFNENVALGLPEAIPFTASSAVLESAIGTPPATGRTSLYDAIAKASEHLQTGSRDKKVLIVISDGGDNASMRSDLDQVVNMAERSSTIIYTIGIFDKEDPDQNPRVLKRLARTTGGEAFLPAQFSEVVAICGRIARDIRHQYTIGYVPINLARDGAYRAIRVVARAKGHGKLAVRTRAGYRAGGEPRIASEGAK